MKRVFFYLLCFFCVCAFNAQAQSSVTVATDGTGDYSTIQTAINAASDVNRTIIKVKNGIYNEKVSIGAKGAFSSKKISLIGESEDGVIISSADALPNVSTFENCTTFKIYASDFYAQNVTFRNTAGNTGQALALYNAGDRQTFYHCKLLGYQDTQRSLKNTRSYFKDCFIEGATDFIYAGGTIWYEGCTLHCLNGGGYITAPEDITVKVKGHGGRNLYFGFIFNNCTITTEDGVADGAYYLGRPWASSFCGSIYVKCKMGSFINNAGWVQMSGNVGTKSSFAEYKSMDYDGTAVDTTKRVSWSIQLKDSDVIDYMNQEYVFNKIFKKFNASAIDYNPDLLIAASQTVAISEVKLLKEWYLCGTNLLFTKKVSDVYLSTISGQRVMHQSNVDELSLDKFSSGCYLMTFVVDGQCKSTKVIIKK